MAKAGRKRKREKRTVREGVAHIKSTFNNTVISITDKEGNVLSWAVLELLDLKGQKRGLLLPLSWLLNRQQKGYGPGFARSGSIGKRTRLGKRDCYSVFAGRWFNHQLYKRRHSYSS